MANQQKPDATDSGFSAALVAADGTRYELTGEQTLGRSDEANITIVHPKISRRHARFCLAGQQLTVEDLGSANGTRVNQRRIDGVVELSDGDVLNFDAVDLTVVITGLTYAEDATVIGRVDDATIIGSRSGFAPDKPADAPPLTQPEPARAAEPAAAQSKRVQVDAPPVDLPGSWVDQALGEYTQVLSGMDVAAHAGAGRTLERTSDLPHLVIIQQSGSQQVLELEPGGGEQPDVWEIGRDDSCQIIVPEASVSSRHAQLIHQAGKWKLVNLVSTNGVFVNGEKRLTAYLADGDEIKLGTAALIFRTGSAASAARSTSAKNSDGARGKLYLRIALALGVIAVAVAFGLWVFLRQS